MARAESNLGFVASMYGMHTYMHVTSEPCTSSPPSAREERREERRLTSSAIISTKLVVVWEVSTNCHKG